VIADFFILAAESSHLRALTFDPAFNPFLLLLLGAAVTVAVFYLYREQQKIASLRIVGFLTGIRIALILLLLIMLLRPLRQWSSTRNAGGTLWVLLDQSLSMNQLDPQASAIERLRWADALGYLPADLRQSKLDERAAELAALGDELQYLQFNGGSNGDAIKSWRQQLNDLAAKLQRDPQAGSIAADLQRIAAADTLGRDGQAALATDLKALNALADRNDTDCLATHGGNPQLQQALAKVTPLRRSDLARAALTASSSQSQSPRSLAQVVESQDTHIVLFSGAQHAMDLSGQRPLRDVLNSTPPPAGHSTNIADALKFVGEQISPGDQASVLLVSDGRGNDGGDPMEPARHLAAQGARIFTLTVGSHELARDAAVESIDAPDWIFKDDTLRVSALLRFDGLTGKPCTVELHRGPDLIDTQTFVPKTSHVSHIVTFHDKPPDAKLYDYDVHIVEMPEEATHDNNRQSFRVAVKSDKLHALIVEDQPRWEYRYLANYLARDNRVQLQTVLLEPARVADILPPTPIKASATNAQTIEAQILPQSKDEWAAFDLIVLGDVPIESLSTEAQQNIASAVRDRGAALLVIAGPQNMPGRYAGTPLADLLPVDLNTNWTTTSLQEQLLDGFRAVVAPEGAKSILCQLGLDDTANGELWAALPAWYWHSEQTQAKLSASVLWSIADMHPKDPPADPLAAARQRALLCTMSVGLGRVMYLASDSTWRMRQVDGQDLHERFWGQFIRWVVGSDLPAGGKFVRFGTNKPRYADGESIQVTARLLKEDLSPLAGEQFQVLARSGGGDGKIVGQAQMQDSPETPGLYHATLAGIAPGTIELSLRGTQVEKLLAEDPSTTSRTLGVEVMADENLEMQNVNADPQSMQQLAQAGGGVALDAPYFDVMADHIPNLRQDRTTVEQVGLFTDPKDHWTRVAHWSFLLLFVGLITLEWIVRKAGGLV
jgi:hypothetical protein